MPARVRQNASRIAALLLIVMKSHLITLGPLAIPVNGAVLIAIMALIPISRFLTTFQVALAITAAGLLLAPLLAGRVLDVILTAVLQPKFLAIPVTMAETVLIVVVLIVILTLTNPQPIIIKTAIPAITAVTPTAPLLAGKKFAVRNPSHLIIINRVILVITIVL